MSRPIDAELISRKAAVSRISDLIVLELRGERIPTWNEVYKALNDLPTVDAVPVVRCKDCKYYQTDDVKCPCNIGLENSVPDAEYTWVPEPDWFCADGERRES